MIVMYTGQYLLAIKFVCWWNYYLMRLTMFSLCHMCMIYGTMILSFFTGGTCR